MRHLFRQYHSPYLAMGNNPMRFIDPLGGQDEPQTGANDPIYALLGYDDPYSVSGGLSAQYSNEEDYYEDMERKYQEGETGYTQELRTREARELVASSFDGFGTWKKYRYFTETYTVQRRIRSTDFFASLNMDRRFVGLEETPNTENSLGDGPGQPINEISTNAIFRGQRPNGTFFVAGPYAGWQNNSINDVFDPRAVQINKASYDRAVNSINYFLSGGIGPAPPELQPGYVFITWPRLSNGSGALGWKYGVARIRDFQFIPTILPNINGFPAIVFLGNSRITYELNSFNPPWDPLVPRR